MRVVPGGSTVTGVVSSVGTVVEDVQSNLRGTATQGGRETGGSTGRVTKVGIGRLRDEEEVFLATPMKYGSADNDRRTHNPEDRIL